MAVDCIRWAYTQIKTLKLTPTEGFVLVTVADCINTKLRYAWPSQATLMEKTNLASSSVNRALKSLEERGLIVRKWRGGTTTKYKLALDGTPTTGDGTPTVGVENPGVLPQWETIHNKSKNHNQNHEEAATTAAPTPLSGKGETTMKLPKGMSVAAVAAASAAEYQNVKDEEILNVARVNTKFTAAGLDRCWRLAHGKYVAGFQPQLRQKERGQLVQAYKQVGDVLPALILLVCSDWMSFVRHAEKESGAFKMPNKPSIGHFLLYVQAAVSLALKREAEAAAPKPKTHKQLLAEKQAKAPAAAPVQLIADEPASTKLTVADIEEVDSDLNAA